MEFVHVRSGRCFNPRPRTRGDPTIIIQFGLPESFNPRPRTRGDQSEHSYVGINSSFNPRPRTRGDTLGPIIGGDVMSFNPRPRTRGDEVFDWRGPLPKSFNPRPRTRGDFRISWWNPSTLSFQSTPPHEGRRGFRSGRPLGQPVSIHAPARGATPKTNVFFFIIFCFNPRPRTRGDCLRVSPCYYWALNHFCANLPAIGSFLSEVEWKVRSNLQNNTRLTPARTPRGFYGRFRFAQGFQTIKGPSGSYPALAPTCSTRRFQFLPRK